MLSWQGDFVAVAGMLIENDYFCKHAGVRQKITIREGRRVTAMVGSARLYVVCHKRKLLIVALKY